MFLLLALCAPAAWARIDGEAEWGYAHFEQTSDNIRDLTASHFTQRYSLMYNTEGLIAAGRGGFYDLGIGAEWGAFESKFGDEKIDKDALKFLYEGQLQIAPGALPFRFNAYSYDLQKIQFDWAGDFSSGFAYATPYRLINPHIISDLNNGQTIVSGVQFMGGIRNGTYLGKYREILSQWPRVLVDYRDVYRRDMKSSSPEKYRDRNLAFVSLNKKDNWFHYRTYTHKDYLNPRNDSEEYTLLLGTIDHTLKRQWINLTNWIRISVDGSYTEIDDNWKEQKTERFDINFYTIMQRSDFAASSLVNMQRVKEGSRLENLLDVPVFFSKSINPDTSVRSTFELWRQNHTYEDFRRDWDDEAFHTQVLFETNKRGLVQINPSLEMEVHRGDRGEGEALRGKVEAYGNRLRRQPATWYGMSSLGVFDGTSEAGNKTDMWEAELQGSVTYRLRNNVVVGADQHLLYGEGSYGTQATRFMLPTTGQGFDRLGTDTTRTGEGSLFRSQSTLYLELTSSSRMTNRFQLYYKYEDSDTENLDSLELSHRLSYQSRWWRATLEHFYVTGDDSDYIGSGSGYLKTGTDTRGAKEQFFQRGTLEFRPNNYWLSRLDTHVSWGKSSSEGDDLFVQVKQKVERTFYAPGSVRRKRGDITQSLVYEQFKDGIDRRAIVFSLAGNYYPTTFWRFGADVFYYDYDFQPDYYSFSLSTGLDFPLFKVDFSYIHAAMDEENTVADRYELNVKKTF